MDYRRHLEIIRSGSEDPSRARNERDAPAGPPIGLPNAAAAAAKQAETNVVPRRRKTRTPAA